ncbi:MAG: ATP synthase F1 subunit epsilon [Kosmotogaceae bacterium]
MSLNVKLVTPYGIEWEGTAELLSFQTVEGSIAFLPLRAPMVCQLAVEKINIQSYDKNYYFAVHGGYLLNERDSLTIVADAAEKPEDIDIERARRHLERAKELVDLAKDTQEKADLSAQIQRNILRERVYKEHK